MTDGVHCDLCDLPLAYCPHGQPKPTAPPESEKPAPRAPARTRSAVRATSSTARKAPAKEKPREVSTRRTGPRRWTPPEDFTAAIIVVLTEAGGELQNGPALAGLEALLGDRLTEGDREKGPTGELRWHLAARKARQQLIVDGRMVKARPGAWTLA